MDLCSNSIEVTSIYGRIKYWQSYRSSCPEVLCKKGVLKNFAKLTEKHPCQSFFLHKVAGLRPATLFKKRLWHIFFPVSFPKFFKLSKEHFRWLLVKVTTAISANKLARGSKLKPQPTGMYLLKDNCRNTRARCKIYSTLTFKTPVFIVKFIVEHISHLALVSHISQLWTCNYLVAKLTLKQLKFPSVNKKNTQI